MRLYFLFVVVGLVLFGVCPVGADDPHVWVVAVGVSKYTRSEYHGLDSASDNARRIAQAFRDARPEDTTVYELTSDSPEPAMRPNLPNTLEAISTIRRRAKAADRIVVYFCGHGIESTEGTDVQQYLLLTDASDLSSEEMLKSSCLNVGELKKKLETILCAERLLWLDACRETPESLTKSGGVDNGQSQTKSFETTSSQWQAPVGNSATLFGCRAGEKVYYGKRGQSFFSEALVDGLTGRAADEKGAVTLASLAKYVGERVPKDVQEELGASFSQHPALIPDIPGVVLRPGVGYIACPAYDGEQGDLFSETVQTRLASSSAIHLVERMRLKDALSELKLQDTALVDSSSARQLGKLVGAKYVLVGSSRKGPDGKYYVNARLIVAETGQNVPGVAARCSADPENWEPSVTTMATDLLKRMCGPVLPEDTIVSDPEPPGRTPNLPDGKEVVNPDGSTASDVGEPRLFALNGHYYLEVLRSRTWFAAKSEAEGLRYKSLKGHLATVTSGEEQDFLKQLNIKPSPWLGAFQPARTADPSQGWQWVTGEPFVYTHWASGEPNGKGEEDGLCPYYDMQWNNLTRSQERPSFLVEFEPDSAKPPSGKTSVNTIDGAEMLWVPEGDFLAGLSNDQAVGLCSLHPDWNPAWLDRFRHLRPVRTGGYWVYKYEVTVAQYKKFCSATHRTIPEAPTWGWVNDHPIVNVTWDDARAYANWAGGRVPSEAEWEKAARGTEGQLYVWGNEWREDFAHSDTKLTFPVGAHPADSSPYGCKDMAGNAWEWTASLWSNSMYVAPVTDAVNSCRVIRGGCWDGYQIVGLACYSKYADQSKGKFDVLGFRIVR